MGKYTIQQLAEILVKKNGLNEKEAQDFVVAIFEIVKEGLEQDKLVKIKGFGTFKIIDIDPRASINVNTGERVLIEGHQKITFTPDAVMKEMVNRPFSQFETVILNDGVDLSEIDRTYNFEPDNNTGVEESETEQDNTQDTQDNTQETQDNTQDTQDTQAEVSTEKTTIVEEPEPTIVETTEEPETTIVETTEETEPTIVETTEEPEPPTITSEEVPAREAVADGLCDQEEEDDDDDDDTASPDVFDDDSETSGSYWKWVVAAVVCLILMAAAAYGGYMFGLEEGKHQEKKSQIADYAAQLDKQTAELRKQRLANQEQALADTSATAKKVADTSPTKKEVSATSPATQSATSTPSAEEDYSRYNTSDVRIRTGAYIIIGIDKTVTAQEGQTIGKIAQSQLGPGMSCYVEAVNGMKENTVLKKGTRIKIPKLRHKKKKLPVNR